MKKRKVEEYGKCLRYKISLLNSKSFHLCSSSNKASRLKKIKTSMTSVLYADFRNLEITLLFHALTLQLNIINALVKNTYSKVLSQ